MQSILDKAYEARMNNVQTNRPGNSVETAGSLAMNVFHSLFETNTYDEFSSSNPFAVDYSMYSDYSDGASVAYGGFLSNFSNALSTLGNTSGFTGGGDCGFTGSCSSGGSFTSFC